MKQLMLLFVVVVCCYVNTYGQECDAPQDSFEDIGFYSTETFAAVESRKINDEGFANIAKQISADYIKEQQESKFAVGDDLREYIEAAELDEVPSATSYIAPKLWYTTCPYWWYLVPRYHYYNYNSYTDINGVTTYRYCWSYYRFYIARCYWKNCRVSNNVLYTYGFLYRCVPEYRTIRALFVCLEVKKNPKGTVTYNWVRRWQKLSVPYGCCCRRYFYDIKEANQCAVPKYVEEQ